MKITCEFRGGLDQIFKQSDLELDVKDNINIRDLVDILAQNHVKRTPELFTKEKAGILVLINDTDWELMDCYDYEIQDKDTIGFISTLHGG